MRKWWVDKLIGLTNRLVISNLILTYLSKWYYEMLGLRVGKDVILSRIEFSLEDVDLLAVKDNAFVGAGPRFSYATTTKNEKGAWIATYSPIELGERSWIGAWCSMGPGVKIGKNSVVSDFSHVTQSTNDESFVLGLPTATAFKKARKKGIAPEKPIKQLHHFSKFVLENLVLCALILVRFTALIPGYHILQVIVEKGNDNLYANVAGLVLLFIIGIIYTFLFAILLQLLLGYVLGKNEKKRPLFSVTTYIFVISFINLHTLIGPVLVYLRGTFLMNSVFRFLGSKIGKDVFIFSPKVTAEFQIFSLGDRTVINEDGLIILHSFKNFEFHLIPATVGSDCNFGSWSSIHSNTVDNGVVFLPGSKPMPGISVKSNMYTNNPAVIIKTPK